MGTLRGAAWGVLFALALPLAAEPPDGTALWTLRYAFGTPPGSLNAVGWRAAVQPDGRIVVVGSVEIAAQVWAPALVRLADNGDLDPSFGVDGRVANPIPGETDRMEPQALALEPGTGRILVAGVERLPGYVEKGFVLRLLPDGSPDPTFDGDGLRRIVFGFSSPESTALRAVAGASDGSIMVAGDTYFDADGNRFALARLREDGSLDPAFDGDGLRTVGFAGHFGRAQALVRQGDGGAVVAGTASPVTTANDAVVVRLLADGALDPDFGAGGLVAIDWGLDDASVDGAAALALLEDGRLVLGGFGCSHDGLYGFCDRTTWAVARLLADGSPDPTFGTAGRIHGPLCEPPGCPLYLPGADDLVTQGDGRILFTYVHQRDPDLELDFGVIRLLPDGAADPGFGAGGLASIDFGSVGDPRSDVSYAVALAPDGRPVVGGQTSAATGPFEFAVARLASAYVFADGFEAGSTAAWSVGSLGD